MTADDAARPADAGAKRVLAAGLWVLAASLMLTAPALIWGRPFVFGDTIYYWGWGGDILEALRKPWPHAGQLWVTGRSLHGWGFGLHDATPADLRFNLTWLTARSAFYAAPFHLLARLGGLWLVAGVQALLAAGALKIAVRAVAPAASGWVYLAIVAALAATSSLGFETGYMMPDLFGGLAILAAAVLTAYPQRLAWGARFGLAGLVVYAVLAHAENGLNVAAAVVLGFLWHWRAGAGWRTGIARTAPTAIALAVGLAVAAAGAWGLDLAFGRPVQMAPFAASRMLADGGAQPYLRQTCPRAPLAACDLAARPPVHIEYYLWIYPLEAPPPAPPPDPVKYSLAQFDRLEARHVTDAEADHRERFVAEQLPLVLGGLRTDGISEAREALANAIVAVFNFGVGADFDSAQVIARGGQTSMRAQMTAILPGQVECVGSLAAACGRFGLGWTAPIQYAAVLLALAGLAAYAVRRPAALKGELGGFLFLVLGLVLVNACLCGVLSGPYARYQARVEWLVPFAALAVVAQARKR